MRFSVVIFACLAAALGVVAEQENTVPPSRVPSNQNDQDPLGGFLGKEPETESSEATETIVDELPPPEGEELFDEEEEEEELAEQEEIFEEEEKAGELAEEAEGEFLQGEFRDDPPEDTEETETAETPNVVDEEEDLDLEAEGEPAEDEASETSEQGEEPEETRPPKKVDEDKDFEAPVEGETPGTPGTPVGEEKEASEAAGMGEEDGETSLPSGSDTESSTEEGSSGFTSEEGVFQGKEEENPVDVVEGEGDFPTPADIDNSQFAQTTEEPTPQPYNRFTPYPSAYRQPSLRPQQPYVSRDDDPLKDDENVESFDNWGFNKDTVDEVEKDVEEMAHDTKVIIALSTVFGVMFFFSVFVAYQMLENPNGCCASLCRISVACWCGLMRCICYPCRAMCGCTGQNAGAQDHMMLPNDGHFTHDLELS